MPVQLLADDHPSMDMSPRQKQHPSILIITPLAINAIVRKNRAKLDGNILAVINSGMISPTRIKTVPSVSHLWAKRMDPSIANIVHLIKVDGEYT
jgi:hypothetical protein